MIIPIGGGGSAKGIAAIKAVWPEGYSGICYLGTKKLRAKKGVTEWIFLLPELGTWTVEAADGTETLSESVKISVEGQTEVVELSLVPKGALYYYGDECENVTGGWASKGLAISSGSGGNVAPVITSGAESMTIDSNTSEYKGGIAYTQIPFDLTDITTITFTGNVIKVSSDYMRLIVRKSVDEYWGVSMPACYYFKTVGEQTCSLDVSALSGEYYIMFGFYGPCSIEIKSLICS